MNYFTSVLLVISAHLFTMRLASAYPNYWYDALNVIGSSLPNGPTQCDSHPTEAVIVQGSPHPGGPTIDSSITFVFRGAQSGAVITTLCPGMANNLSVSFSNKRLALLTANTSSVAFSSALPTSDCPNRVDLGGSSKFRAATTFNVSFNVPCSLAGQNVRFEVTSAAIASTTPWLQNSVNMPVSLGAVCGTCTSPRPPPVPSPPPLPPPAPSPPPLPPTNARSSTPPPSPPTPPASPTCMPSPLGYDCVATKGKVTVHWSVNSSTAPANPCTPVNRTTLTANELSVFGTLHMAVQANIQGYVAIGFNSNPKKMYPSDIALGWSGSSLNTYYAKGEDLEESDISPSSWAYDTGIAYNASAIITTICFSRRLVDSRAKASPDLRSATGSNRNTTTATTPTSGRRLLQTSQGNGQLGLIWAISFARALVQHTSQNVGGFDLNLAEGTVQAAGNDRKYWVNVHGALMAVAWGLLLPLGTLLPAHRWLLRDVKLAGKHLWFWLHLGCQWTGMALFIAGFVVAFVEFEEVEGNLSEAHGAIGIAIMAAAGAQVVFAYIRPDPNSEKRGLWNLVHHNLGRLTILLAWANVYIGIYLAHTSWGASYTEWVTPIAIVMGLLLITTLVLRLLGPSGAGGAPARGNNASAFNTLDYTAAGEQGVIRGGTLA
ncbi:hypothetical protein Vretimale_45 [Volvox reticuliferus]|uniref:Cytochrome b561 domain-containing protein n=1 Tax=Volvox reticuliferus TaxID=1737510 RepID=A0A8J4CAT7_9CHLO|nr:hypothetical protein Vretifemale_8461 [Volvox reticuliferus]GIL93724.1 hypothetical protein Vretimale_45 [Volvox reticuliferus]